MNYLNTQYPNIGYSNYPNYASRQSFRGERGDGQDSTNFGGVLTAKETKALTDCYISTPSESVLGAAWGGVSFALMNNARLVAHPINTYKAFAKVDPMFKDVLKEGTELNKLWVNPETNGAMRDAYCEMHRAFARGEKKLGWFRKQYSEKDLGELQKTMQKALDEAKGKSPEEARKILTTATETLKSAYISDGRLGFIGKLGTGSGKAKTFEEGFADTATISKQVSESMKFSPTSFRQALKKHAGFRSIIGWAGFQFLFDFGNVIKAFQKDRENKENGIKSNYGIKQVGQTAVQGAGAGLGWGVGEAFGNWAFTKWGSKLGAKLHPALGTATGGVAGLVGASLGMMFMNRLTKKLVGNSIGEQLQAQELTQTPDGQVQLLEGVYKKVQSGEASPEARAAMQKLLTELQASQLHG